MKDAITQEFKALRREAKLRDKAIYKHYEARIDNLEKRVTRDIEEDQRRIDTLRDELNRAIENNTTRVVALERREAGGIASDAAHQQEATRRDTWKLAILGTVVTVTLAIVIFIANLVTGHP